jgi:hypothetical protein
LYTFELFWQKYGVGEIVSAGLELFAVRLSNVAVSCVMFEPDVLILVMVVALPAKLPPPPAFIVPLKMKRH